MDVRIELPGRRAGCARAILGWMLAGVSLGGLTGCSQDGGRGPGPSPVQHPLLENIPLPNGFRLVDDQSVGRSAGKLRVSSPHLM